MDDYNQAVANHKADYEQNAQPILAQLTSAQALEKTTFETADAGFRATLKTAQEAYDLVANDVNLTAAQIAAALTTLNGAIADFLVAEVQVLTARDVAEAQAQNAAAKALNALAVQEAIADAQATADEAHALNAAAKQQAEDDAQAEYDFEVAVNAAYSKEAQDDSQSGNDYLHTVNAAGKTQADADNKSQNDWVHGWSALQSDYSEAAGWAEARRTNAKNQAQSLMEVGTETALAAAKNRWALALNSFQATYEVALEQATATKLTTIAPLQLAAQQAKSDGEAQWVTDVKSAWVTGTNAVADHAKTAWDTLAAFGQQLFDNLADHEQDFEEDIVDELQQAEDEFAEDERDFVIDVATAEQTEADAFADASLQTSLDEAAADGQLCAALSDSSLTTTQAESAEKEALFNQVGSSISQGQAFFSVPPQAVASLLMQPLASVWQGQNPSGNRRMTTFSPLGGNATSPPQPEGTTRAYETWEGTRTLPNGTVVSGMRVHVARCSGKCRSRCCLKRHSPGGVESWRKKVGDLENPQ